jgi:hypothetical protein
VLVFTTLDPAPTEGSGPLFVGLPTQEFLT